jgi:two-component system, NarL family, response regulator DevR
MIRIVLVDDHEMVREGLLALLETEPDFEVVGQSGSAEELAALVEMTRPDIVLLDARLPGISGPDACHRLLETHPEVRVIILTSYSDDDLVDQSIRAGAKGFVVKDVERFTLRQSIRAVHRGEGFIAPAVAGKILDRLRAQDSAAPRPALSESQLAILRLVAEGFSNREIATRVYLSENTVKSHLQEILQKLGVRNRVEAAIRATKEGWI